jgi:hypothetical protein
MGPLPCSPIARLPPTPTQATLPRYGVSNTWLTKPGTGNHTGSRSGSCVSHELHRLGHVAIGCYPEDTAAVCPPFRVGIVSEHPARFQGTERRSSPLPIGYGFLRFGIVSQAIHWQALTGLSWLSYSQPRISRGPRVGKTRTGRLRGSVLPTPATVERTFFKQHVAWAPPIRTTHLEGPDPRDGICTRFDS